MLSWVLSHSYSPFASSLSILLSWTPIFTQALLGEGLPVPAFVKANGSAVSFVIDGMVIAVYTTSIVIFAVVIGSTCPSV